MKTNKTQKLEAKYGLPEKVVFCKKCVQSNQIPSSIPEFKHTINTPHPTVPFDKDGVCNACRFAEIKEKIDWAQRQKELLKLLDEYRRDDGFYDCLVPGSGGKDSAFAAHVLKYKYGMHPLTVTWPPILYTDIGWQNFRNWIEVGGIDNITLKPNGHVIKLLTRLSIENLLHPFQSFILGQKNLAPKIAAKFNIPLVFYGENEAEYNNPIADNSTSLRSKSFHAYAHLDGLYLAGLPIKSIMKDYNLSLADLSPFLPTPVEELSKSKIEVHYLGYYLKWVPQEAYYYAVEHTGFRPNPFRTEGTYSKYNSLDDKIDGFHYYTTFIKFGVGRATYEAAQEIRNNHLTRGEGVALVKKFDGEFPGKYFKEVMDYIGMKPERFLQLCDEFRSPHLWEKVNGKWILKHQVS